MDPAAPSPRPPSEEDLERCASCGERLRPRDARSCALCGRRTCLRCLAPYGHFMQACEECRLASW
ncbi:hypothetical protein [Anaeromyxobacter sp. SG66]|uniref:hypothetical protein n=1 Tax=Anaeromyxobacter sp. SG66 TaxID=2925410 RepID=UPI001F5ABA04|nr:hypothetical protein [Anaeromyxobacter sp. SG66]